MAKLRKGGRGWRRLALLAAGSRCLYPRAGIAAVAADAGADDGGKLLVRCWSDDPARTTRRPENCCREEGALAADNGCFDDVVTYEECCEAGWRAAGAFATGSTTSGPTFDAEGNAMALLQPRHAPAAWPGGPCNGPCGAADVDAWRPAPVSSPDQQRWERDHKLSSRTLRFTWTFDDDQPPLFLVVRIFKRSAAAARSQLEGIPRYMRELERAGGLQDGEVFLDAGASLGALAIAVAVRFPRARVVAVEPSAESYRYLVWNLRLNQVEDRVWPMNVALAGPGVRQLRLRYSPIWLADASRAGLHVGDAGESSSEGSDDWSEESVPATSLGELVASLQLSVAETRRDTVEAAGSRPIRWLKLDCDGCEWSVLDGQTLQEISAWTAGTFTVFYPRALAASGAADGVAASAALDAVRALCPASAGGSAGDDDGGVSAGPRALRRALQLRSHADGGGSLQEMVPELCVRSLLVGGGASSASSAAAAAETAPFATAAAATAGEAAAADNALVASSPRRLRSGGRVLLFSSFSHDDLDQWPLLPHFIAHYRDRLGIDPGLFLLLLHSGSGNETGLAHLARRLWREYGIGHTFPITGPFTAELIFENKIRVLHRFVSPEDWVVEADGDEFVVFPRHGLAVDALDAADAAGYNVQYGVMVDQVARNGNLETAVRENGSIFGQFPLSCAMTWRLQRSDVRKASAYRGYLRSVVATHSVLGLNASAAALTADRPRARLRQVRRLLGTLRAHFGERTAALLPYAEAQDLPELRPCRHLATVYHFKWVKGVAEKLTRRTKRTDRSGGGLGESYGEYYTGIYAQFFSLRGDPASARAAIGHHCKQRDLPDGQSQPLRGLTTRELVVLFTNFQAAFLEQYAVERGEFAFGDSVLTPLLNVILYGIARIEDVPTD